MSLTLDLVFNATTGTRTESTDFRAVAYNAIEAKIQPSMPVRIRLASQYTGALVPASGDIQIGFKPPGHYSDPAFDVYSDAFAPVGTSGDDLLTYAATVAFNGEHLTALFAPNTSGVSPDFVDLIGEVVIGGVPTMTFTLKVYNNVIKGTETPPSADDGIPLYPTSAATNTAVAQAGRASRDYVGDITRDLKAAIAGKTAGTGTYSLCTDGTFTVRNLNAWNHGVFDFTFFSLTNSAEVQYQGGVLLKLQGRNTSNAVLLAAHFSDPTPTSLRTGSIVVTSGGSGYTSAPAVSINGSGGGATATVSGGVVTGVTVPYQLDGYTTTPVVTFSGGGGTGAAATATLSAYGSNPMTAGPTGTVMTFLDGDGTAYTRTFASLTRAVKNGSGTDHLIGILSSDLPAGVRPVRLLPADLSIFARTGVPMVFSNLAKQVRIGAGVLYGSDLAVNPASDAAFSSWSIHLTDTVGDPTVTAPGDSGSPAGVVLDGEFLLAWLFHSYGHGESVAADAAAINATLGSAGSLDIAPDFRGTHDPLAPHQGEDAGFNNLGMAALNLAFDTTIKGVAPGDTDDPYIVPWSVLVIDGNGCPALLAVPVGHAVRRGVSGWETYAP